MPRLPFARSTLLVLSCSSILAHAATAQTAATSANDKSARTLDEVIVMGQADRQLLLDTNAESSSRLGLSVRETPATIEVLTEERFREQGLATSIEALDTAPGVQAAFVPGAPSTTSMRGFTGGAVSLLYDGVRLSTSSMIGRNYDTWSFQRIEVLKGPASVLYGEGSIAGAINLVPKRPRFDQHELEGMVSGGSFATYRMGIGAGGPLAPTLG